ncbi:MAG: hypothetical protein KF703_14080, partial [Actinobacteria bacterium]|nr:hypothetical protein [Actinomycetota bacterium]
MSFLADLRPTLGRAVQHPRHRLLTLVVLTGLLGGLVGAAYLALLDALAHGLGPARWSPAAHLGILAAVGLVVAALTHRLGNPADVELLVD